ncbi:hypothetical protein CWB85_10395 [Pseudoalteromonas sp. S1727]|uniref:tetratricopeptide repeat protein n=2 Tax=Pseudoalteromonas TaxID=53246 RepID=UPI001107E625|nr:tetratricopeptide repeat protein [Pseudoalteromonas sp. S1727]TMN71562.1 hypothetical protein CWB85_10395 [Pseudoalteromonas sp. S1727]
MQHLLIVFLLVILSLSFHSWADPLGTAAFERFVQGIEQQQKKTDTVTQGKALLAESLTEEQRAYVLHKVALANNKLGQFDEVERDLDKLEALLKSYDSNEYRGKLYITRGDLAINLGQFNSAQNHFKNAIAMFELTKDYRMLSHTLRFYSFSLKANGQFSEALIAVEKAKEAAKLAENTPVTMAAFNAEAGIYNDLKLPEKALKLQLELLAYVTTQAENPNTWYAQLHYSIGDSYATLKEHEKSLDAYKKAYQYDLENQMFNYAGYDLVQISRQLMALKRYDEAPSYLQHALDLFTELDSPRNIAWVKGNQAELQLLKHQYATAINLFKSVMASLDAVEDKALHQEFSLLYAKALLGTQEQQRAVKVLEGISTNESTFEVQMMKLNLLSQAYSELNKFADAFAMKQQSYTMLEEQLEQDAKSKALGYAAQTQYQTTQIELAEIKNQHKINEIKNQQYLLIIGTIALIMLIGLVVTYILYQQKKKMSEKEAQVLNNSIQLKEQLLADVSHELRTPLTVLKLNIESLEHNLVENPDTTYKILHQRLDRLNQLITDIYELAQSDSGSFVLHTKKYNAYELVSHFADDIATLVTAAGLEFSQHVSIDKTITIELDSDRLNQVIHNLARNTVNYTDTPGKVMFTSQIESGYLKLCLSDSSPGVSEADFVNIFERLYRCDKSRSRDLGGSGLGLAISHKIVSLHGGQINAQASEFGGLAITILLPVEKSKLL